MEVSQETRAVFELRKKRNKVLSGIQAALVSRWKNELEPFASFQAFQAAYGEPTRSYDPKLERHTPGGPLIVRQHYYRDFEGLQLTWRVYEDGTSKVSGSSLSYGDEYGAPPTGEAEAASQQAYQTWLAGRDPIAAVGELGPPDDWFESTLDDSYEVWGRERHVYFDVEGLGFDIIMVTYDSEEPTITVLPHRRRYSCLVGPFKVSHAG